MNARYLRKKYPKFIYEKYTYGISKNDLEILFSFRIPPDIEFQPRILIRNINKANVKRLGKETLDNLVFNLGLIEMLSYWKATCSPEILVKAGSLDKTQINWWENLIIKGLGQFFYENKIDWRVKGFIAIESSGKRNNKIFNGQLKNRYLVPFAGGRDSIVTLENLKKTGKEISLFTVNPIEKIRKTIKASGIKNRITVKRVIDRNLLSLNKKGYLNGHTPFTATLSFISLLCAAIFNYKNIAFSNEKSAEEGNLKYLGRTINHQWAKTLEFERSFPQYARKHLVKKINYFSFLRKYGELEISKTFIKYPQYFSVFSSCNEGMKINTKGELRAKKRWCGNCPKCLFVYLSLYPFLPEKQLLKIFSKDIFENRKLLKTMQQLIGERGFKPFECVGTKKENKLAFKLSKEKALRQGKSLPFLLAKAK